MAQRSLHAWQMASSANYRRPLFSICLVGQFLWPAAHAAADIFRLEQGGQVEGEWLNQDEQPLTKYVVRTAAGVTLSLPVTGVREAVRQSPAEQEYARRAAATADTPEAQWALAEWCRQNSLSQQRRVHLQRIVELDANNIRARQLLGFQFINGEWISRDDHYRKEGYEFYRGKWRTPQEIEILETKARTEIAEKDWLLKLRRFRAELDTERAKQAYDALAAIRDPIAVKALGKFFEQERVRRVKVLYADVLAQINTQEAIMVLVSRVVNDRDEEVFYYCLDRLAEVRPPRIEEPFIRYLQDSKNEIVNRAAIALARFQERPSIPPLIEALITTHKELQAGRPGAGPGSTTTGFSDSGTFMKQDDGPRIILHHVQNQQVLDALTKMTGVSFGYDQKAWRAWYAQDQLARESGKPVVDARRQ